MTPAIAPTVTATSAMLTAYVFFYTAFKDRLEAGTAVGERAGNADDLKAQKATVTSARRTAMCLGLVPLFIWIIFIKAAYEEARAGFDVGFALSAYSPLDIVFFFLANSWLLIGVVFLVRAKQLGKKLEELR